jgi:hypothetical protein
LVRAKADPIRLAAVQLQAIGSQRRAWECRMAELLLGARPTGKSAAPGQSDPATPSLAQDHAELSGPR